MKQSLLLVLVLAGLIGCGSTDEPTGPETVTIVDKIIDWQEREAGCQDTEEQDEGIHDNSSLDAVLTALVNLIYFDPVHYTPDTNGDVWKTSCETAQTMEGDCEDQAFYWYAQLREHKWFADFRLSLVFINHTAATGERSGHMLVRIDTHDAPVWIDNNMVRVNLNSYKELKVVAEFDLWSHWM